MFVPGGARPPSPIPPSMWPIVFIQLSGFRDWRTAAAHPARRGLHLRRRPHALLLARMFSPARAPATGEAIGAAWTGRSCRSGAKLRAPVRAEPAAPAIAAGRPDAEATRIAAFMNVLVERLRALTSPDSTGSSQTASTRACISCDGSSTSGATAPIGSIGRARRSSARVDGGLSACAGQRPIRTPMPPAWAACGTSTCSRHPAGSASVVTSVEHVVRAARRLHRAPLSTNNPPPPRSTKPSASLPSGDRTAPTS